MGFVYQESTGRTGNEPVKVRFSTHGFPFIAAYASFSRLNACGAFGRYTGRFPACFIATVPLLAKFRHPVLL